MAQMNANNFTGGTGAKGIYFFSAALILGGKDTYALCW